METMFKFKEDFQIDPYKTFQFASHNIDYPAEWQ